VIVLFVLLAAFIYQLVVNKSVDKVLAGMLTIMALAFFGYRVDRALERLGG
jgi:hypothetical protein